MAHRDLTARFHQLREFRFGAAPLRTAHDDKTDVALLEDAGAATSWAVTKAQLPPAWVERVDRVDADVRAIQSKMRSLSALHTRRLMVSFDDADEAHKERDIELLTQEITQVFRHAERELKGIMADRSGGHGGTPSASDGVIRANIQRATARRLQNLSMAFRSGQKEYLVRLRRQKDGGVGGGEFDFLAAEERSAAKAAAVNGGPLGVGLGAAQVAMLESTESYVSERDAEIRQIVKSIEELSIIFKELAVLVIDQGTILDRIDFNMEQVIESTKDGVAQLHKAEESQKQAMPVKCIAALLCLIAVLVLILVIKHR